MKKSAQHPKGHPFQLRLKSRKTKALLVVVSILLLAILFSQVNLAELAHTLAGAKIEWLGLAVVATLISCGVRVLRWKILLDEKVKVPFWELFPIQMAGIAISNFTPGKAAEPLKVVFLRRLKVRYSFGLLSVAWERLFDLILLATLALGVVLGLGGETTQLGLGALVALVIAVFVLHYRLEALTAWLSEFRLLAFLREFETHRFSKDTLWAVAVGTLAVWTLDYVSVWAAFSSVGLSMDYLLVAYAYSASVLLGVVSFLPAGLGSTEAGLLFFLAPTGYYPTAQLLAGIVLARATTLGLSSALGLALMPKAHREEV